LTLIVKPVNIVTRQQVNGEIKMAHKVLKVSDIIHDNLRRLAYDLNVPIYLIGNIILLEAIEDLLEPENISKFKKRLEGYSEEEED